MTSWRAEFTGPNAMNAAATFDAWTDAADWLAAMLRVVQPERGYLEAARALTGAIPGQASRPMRAASCSCWRTTRRPNIATCSDKDCGRSRTDYLTA